MSLLPETLAQTAPHLLLANLLLAAFMTGLIWFVQIVHYPLMGKVGEPGYMEYQRQHQTRTALVVVPAMLSELAVASLLVAVAILPPDGAAAVSFGLSLASLAALIAIWLSTFLVQVPCHQRLERGFDPVAHGRLVRTNWTRTGLWSLRSALAVLMLMASSP